MKKNVSKNKLPSFLKSKKVIVCIVIFVYVVSSIIGSIFQYSKTAIPKPLFIEILYYTTQIASSLFVTGSVIIAVWQYYLSSRSAKTDLEIIQVQRAVDLSEYYKDNILKYLTGLRYLFKESGIYDIAQKIKLEEMRHFDEAELNKSLSDEEIKMLSDISSSDEFFSIFLKANKIYNFGFTSDFDCSNTEDNIDSTKETKSIFDKDTRKMLSIYIGHMFCTILNNMEYFAMHFSHRTADDSVVFESLHQTYIELVHLLYFKIARMNTASASKYYSNVIWLYTKWIDEKNKKDQDFLDGIRSLTTTGTIIEN